MQNQSSFSPSFTLRSIKRRALYSDHVLGLSVATTGTGLGGARFLNLRVLQGFSRFSISPHTSPLLLLSSDFHTHLREAPARRSILCQQSIVRSRWMPSQITSTRFAIKSGTA